MTDFTITHRIEAPELAAALSSLADALKARSAGIPAVPETTSPIQEKPVQAHTEAPVTVPERSPAPAVVPPAVAAPAPAPVEAPATAPAKAYTFEDITDAGSQLLEMNKMPQLMELLKGFGVQAVTQLKPEQYADVAAGLIGLGASI